MATRLKNLDRDTPMFLPPDLRDWVPADHLAHFILDAVDSLDLSQAQVNARGTGSEQYPPGMMLSLLIYCYANGAFSSRKIEKLTYENVAVRLISANTHPDHDTLCAFRLNNGALLQEAFVKVLQMAQELRVLKVGQLTVSIDGTKVLANASKHAAVSYEHAMKQIDLLEEEVGQLMAKAEQADSVPLEEGLTIPDEILRREQRQARLREAKAQIEARARARAALQQAEYEKKMQARAEQRQAGQKPKGSDPKAAWEAPEPKDQYNFTDPESRIMKAGNGKHFVQAYNAQAAVEVESRLIVGQQVSQAANDKQQLAPTLEAIPPEVGDIREGLADSGYFSEQAIEQIEGAGAGSPPGTQLYISVGKTSHHRSVADLEKKQEPPEPAADASWKEKMIHRLKTAEGKAKYKLRQQTVEPVFGIIKEAMGFRRFSLRGHKKTGLEWTLVSLAYNLKRLHHLQIAGKLENQ